MALDCLLIETLQQFFEGKPRTPRARFRGDPERGSEAYFGKFLTNASFRDDFGDHFGTDTLAYRFYDQIRCGILHQGETKGDSRIIFSTRLMWSVEPTSTGIVVNRHKFHARLTNIFRDYISTLKNPKTAEDEQLRNCFRTKMKHICRIEFEE